MKKLDVFIIKHTKKIGKTPKEDIVDRQLGEKMLLEDFREDKAYDKRQNKKEKVHGYINSDGAYMLIYTLSFPKFCRVIYPVKSWICTYIYLIYIII